MKLEARALALASGTAATALFALCALFVVVAPEAAIWASRELFHIAVTSPLVMTWPGFVAGLVFWFVGTAVTAAALASLYSRWARS